MIYKVIGHVVQGRLETSEGVVMSAPDFIYMIGWPMKRVATFCRQRRWTLWSQCRDRWRLAS